MLAAVQRSDGLDLLWTRWHACQTLTGAVWSHWALSIDLYMHVVKRVYCVYTQAVKQYVQAVPVHTACTHCSLCVQLEAHGKLTHSFPQSQESWHAFKLLHLHVSCMPKFKFEVAIP